MSPDGSPDKTHGYDKTAGDSGVFTDVNGGMLSKDFEKMHVAMTQSQYKLREERQLSDLLEELRKGTEVVDMI